MTLKHLSLQNFRSYKKSSFDFSEGTTVIVGPNTSGKTNILEAIYSLALGKSFRTEKAIQMIRFGQDVTRITAEGEEAKLEGVISFAQKKYFVNGVVKRRVDFAGNLLCVLFSPADLDIIIGSPSLRRNFLDVVLEQVDREYRVSHSAYIKALRQRNALLEQTRETGRRNTEQYAYWDDLVIGHGEVLTQKREELIDFINTAKKDIFACSVFYDKSIISKERLLQYKEAEVGAGVTLVGPHRDDFSVHMVNKGIITHDVKLFGSRGQQRLAVLQLKFLQLAFIEERFGRRPLLLLDDIFSELDQGHIRLVLDIVGKQQTILTTTHKEFIEQKRFSTFHVIELG